jgi:chromosome segregation ATPase
MKLNLKTLIIIAFFISFVIFFTKCYIEGDNNRKENKKLKEEIEQIKHIRDSLSSERRKIDLKVDSLNRELFETKKRIDKLDNQLLTNKIELQIAKDKLSSLQHRLNVTKNKIQELKANPIKRKGDDLLNSIKEKTK